MKSARLFQRTLAVFLIMAMLTISAFAVDYTPYADSLNQLGVFYGTDSGYELDRAPTRAEAVAMLVRLLGAQSDADAMQEEALPFSDVPDWARGYVAYAYQNGLTAGMSDTVFGSSSSVTAQMYVTFMLRALGYSETNGDFTYATALSFAQSIGLIDDSLAQTLSSSTFTRGLAAQLSYKTLRFPVAGTDVLLAEQLSAHGKLDADAVNLFVETIITASDQADNTEASSSLTLSELAACKQSVVLLSGTGPSGSGQGSGVILSEDGLILTNYHVIDGMDTLTVTFDDGTVYTGAVYVEDADEALDLALLSIDQTGLTPLPIGDSDSLTVGQSVVAIGSPYGLMNTVSEGIISSVRDGELQITAAISSGSSGGALLNMSGELIGVTYAGITEGQNLGFAIPISKLSSLTARNHTSIAEFAADAAAASTPQNLKVVSLEGNSVYLQWDAVENASYYLVYYKTASGNYTPVSKFGLPQPFTHGTSYSAALNGLRSGMTYSFVVTAVVDGTESAASSPLTVRCP